eukprot:359940-Chlamydomonas_euryale.AAC.4
MAYIGAGHSAATRRWRHMTPVLKDVSEAFTRPQALERSCTRVPIGFAEQPYEYAYRRWQVASMGRLFFQPYMHHLPAGKGSEMM